jgi:hypothetical protein
VRVGADYSLEPIALPAHGLCGGDESGFGSGDFLPAVNDADLHGREGGAEFLENEARSSKAGETLRDERYAAPRFYGGDEAGDAVVFLDDARLSFHRGEELCEPLVILGVVGTTIGDQPLDGGLLDSDMPGFCQWGALGVRVQILTHIVVF